MKLWLIVVILLCGVITLLSGLVGHCFFRAASRERRKKRQGLPAYNNPLPHRDESVGGISSPPELEFRAEVPEDQPEDESVTASLAETARFRPFIDRMTEGFDDLRQPHHLQPFYEDTYQPTLSLHSYLKRLVVPGMDSGTLLRKADSFVREHKRDPFGPSNEALLTIFAFTYENPSDAFTLHHCVSRSMRSGAEADAFKFRQFVYHMSNTITTLPPYIGEVFRGVRGTVTSRHYHSGAAFVWSQFTSATKLMPVATACEPLTVFIIASRTGRLISHLSPRPNDEEVVFLPNSVFRVINFTPMNRDIGHPFDVMELEEITATNNRATWVEPLPSPSSKAS
eukprot:TRINITY_DN21591_c0_g1_i1.p1 TRINITY_DN21591_c0_g1~~TRINITY_DN21591_c0_g1_i1.p1  ORF type:complete len:362 (-),score=38.09 TRINITY_DN21591_c0_g1_i1:131-1150(-)